MVWHASALTWWLCLGVALACTAVAAAAARRWQSSRAAGPLGLTMAVLAAEAVVIAMASGRASFWAEARLTLSALVPGLLLAFSLRFARTSPLPRSWRVGMAAALALPVLLALLPGALIVRSATPAPSALAPAGLALEAAALVVSALALAQLEKTLRASTGSMRWLIKFVVVGLGCSLAVRIYVASQALLFRSLEPSLDVLNVAGSAVAAVLVAVALARMGSRPVEVYLSPSLLYGSVTAAFVGLYLVAVGLLAKAVTRLGAVQALPAAGLVVLVALLALTLVLLSDEARQKLQAALARHLRRPRYDYRAVWTAFTERTSSLVEARSLCTAVVRMLSETLRVPTVTLWLLEDEGRSGMAHGASTLYAEGEGEERARAHGATLLAALGERTEPADLRAIGEGEEGVLREHRCGLPLVSGTTPLGVLLLGERADGEPFSAEDRLLLKTLADQAAASLHNLQLARRLFRAKEMEAFQSLSAFFVHDLKNLASRLSLTVQNLPAHYDDPEFRRDMAATIGRSLAKIEEMCRRLSPLSRHLELKCVEADLNGLVRETLVSMNGSLRTSVLTELGPVPPVMLDPEQMQKVLVNLILNAEEATGGEGEIVVRTEPRDRSVALAVGDNGCGMAPEFVARSLFQPFQSTKSQGLGIGLFHTRKIVEAHQGRIEVESAPGRGSTFRVVLPRGA